MVVTEISIRDQNVPIRRLCTKEGTRIDGPPTQKEQKPMQQVPSFIVNLPVIKQAYVLLNQHRFESHLLHYIQFLCSSTAHLYALPWLR